MTPAPSTTDPKLLGVGQDRWIGYGWPAVVLVTFALAAGVAYRPATNRILWTVLPVVVLLALLVTFSDSPPAVPPRLTPVAAAAAVTGWSLLMFHDDNWSILGFAVYAAAFSAGRRSGILLAAVASTAWAVAWQLDSAPWWTVTIPVGVFIVGTMISVGVYRIEAINEAQAALIEQLHATRAELAEVERAKGIGEERSRLAGEIHDTLAQGFTSIVLLSRAARHADDPAELLCTIEQTAQHSLDATRDLIEATQPPELESGSLPDALHRELAKSVPTDIATSFRVVGQPRRLGADTEITLLRATHEALRNIRTHARASTVEIVLIYGDRDVHLEVHDDGIGAEAGTVADRGSLTGGQGLKVLEQRARALSGHVRLDSRPSGGSVLSLRLPASKP